MLLSAKGAIFSVSSMQYFFSQKHSISVFLVIKNLPTNTNTKKGWHKVLFILCEKVRVCILFLLVQLNRGVTPPLGQYFGAILMIVKVHNDKPDDLEGGKGLLVWCTSSSTVKRFSSAKFLAITVSVPVSPKWLIKIDIFGSWWQWLAPS